MTPSLPAPTPPTPTPTPTPTPDTRDDARTIVRARLALALAIASLAFLVALAATHAPLADHWLTATPFALMAWAGVLSSTVGAVLGTGRMRAFNVSLTMVWLALWVLTFSAEAQDVIASARRIVFAFIAF
jgi:hypothetical protein